MAVNNFPLYIHGYGAVTAAGMGAGAFWRACGAGEELPVEMLECERGGERVSYAFRGVDEGALRGVMPRHARLRRASRVTKFAVTAGYEALGAERMGRVAGGELRVGIVMTFLNGCVNYTNRFFSEVLEDPAFASPILFPETVFNAPASHVAAFLGCDGPVYTLIGDTAVWFSAFEVAEGWISQGEVDGVLMLCAEEVDWLTLEGLGLYGRGVVVTEGAVGVYVEAAPSGVAVRGLHGPFSYFDRVGRRAAMAGAWAALGEGRDVLVDGLSGVGRMDRDEVSATGGWGGVRVSPTRVVGEGLGIRCGLQTVAALEALAGGCGVVDVFAGGGNQQAFSMRLARENL